LKNRLDIVPSSVIQKRSEFGLFEEVEGAVVVGGIKVEVSPGWAGSD
jgi:hypothetical protein